MAIVAGLGLLAVMILGADTAMANTRTLIGLTDIKQNISVMAIPIGGGAGYGKIVPRTPAVVRTTNELRGPLLAAPAPQTVYVDDGKIDLSYCAETNSAGLLISTASCEIEDPDPDSTAQKVTTTTTYLTSPVKVYALFQSGGVHPVDIMSQSFFLRQNDAVYLYAKGTNVSNESENKMDQLGIACDGTSLKIYSTENRRGKTEEWQAVRALFVAPTTGSHVCTLYGAVGDFDGPNPNAYHTYLPGTTRTFMRRTGPFAQDHAWRWGTENDPLYRESSDAVHVGPWMAAGSSEYALRSPRFNAPATAASIDVYAELELTTCNGAAGCGNIPPRSLFGTHVDLKILVQQMAGQNSSTVCKTTYSAVTSFFVSNDDHHKKAHLVAYNVPFDPRCSGRSFIVKTQVTWKDGNIVRIEPGNQGRSRYSTGFAFAH